MEALSRDVERSGRKQVFEGEKKLLWEKKEKGEKLIVNAAHIT